jgi:hypothetical protein
MKVLIVIICSSLSLTIFANTFPPMELEKKLKETREQLEDTYDAITKARHSFNDKFGDIQIKTRTLLISVFSHAEKEHATSIKDNHDFSFNSVDNDWQIDWSSIHRGIPLGHRLSNSVKRLKASINEYAQLVNYVHQNFERLHQSFGHGQFATNEFRKESESLKNKETILKNLDYSLKVLSHYSNKVRLDFQIRRGIKINYFNKKYQLDHKVLTEFYGVSDIAFMTRKQKEIVFENLLEVWSQLRTPIDAEGNLAHLKGFNLEVADKEELEFLSRLALEIDSQIIK